MGPNVVNRDGNRKILIVDDQETTADTLAVIFRDHGYQSRAAYSAEEAIDVIAEWQPDVALLDVNLPAMSGIELAIALRNSHPNCQVLLISGYPSTDDLLDEAMQAGHVFKIICKPVNPTVILDAVAKSLSDTLDEASESVA
jgi:CheY-like chemotaxis protein